MPIQAMDKFALVAYIPFSFSIQRQETNDLSPLSHPVSNIELNYIQNSLQNSFNINERIAMRMRLYQPSVHHLYPISHQGQKSIEVAFFDTGSSSRQ